MEIKIENDKIQNMFEKYKKTMSNSLLKGYFFQMLLKIKEKNKLDWKRRNCRKKTAKKKRQFKVEMYSEEEEKK